nr:hypothetical protein [Acidimicrobiia bacterium]
MEIRHVRGEDHALEDLAGAALVHEPQDGERVSCRTAPATGEQSGLPVPGAGFDRRAAIGGGQLLGFPVRPVVRQPHHRPRHPDVDVDRPADEPSARGRRQDGADPPAALFVSGELCDLDRLPSERVHVLGFGAGRRRREGRGGGRRRRGGGRGRRRRRLGARCRVDRGSVPAAGGENDRHQGGRDQATSRA